MDATQSLICQQDLINRLTTMGIQMSGILILSHLFHLLLKAVGNFGPVAQIRAGLVISPRGLSRITEVQDLKYERSTADHYPVIDFFFGILLMFQIGLEIDICYALRNLRMATTVAYSGILVSVVLGGTFSFFIYKYFDFIGDGHVGYGIFVMIILANTAPPAVIRLTAELKIATSEVGRLDIIAVGLIFAIKYLVFWFNRRIRDQKYLKNTEVFTILWIGIAGAMIIELMSFNCSINCFLLGLMFPREGKSARTLLFKLTCAINNFVLPMSTENIITVVIRTGISIGRPKVLLPELAMILKNSPNTDPIDSGPKEKRTPHPPIQDAQLPRKNHPTDKTNHKLRAEPEQSQN